MKYLPRDVAFGKLANMVRGRDIVRGELRGVRNELRGQPGQPRP
jgi:hypothetical protein